MGEPMDDALMPYLSIVALSSFASSSVRSEMFVPLIPLGSKYFIPNLLRCSNCSIMSLLISSEKPDILPVNIVIYLHYSLLITLYNKKLNVSIIIFAKPLQILLFCDMISTG